MTKKYYNPTTHHTRWYHIDATGEKIIKRFPIGVEPGAPWQRGTGPHKPETAKTLRKHLKENVHPRKVSDETKQKMREAKLGKKFTPEHRAKLKQAQQRLREQKQAKIEEAYRIAQEVARDYYAQRLDIRVNKHEAVQ
jgi:hypothetical protein